MTLNRRELFKLVPAPCLAALLSPQAQGQQALLRRPGWVRGHLTGAEALVETLRAEGTECVFGIPGAQENELWDAMKARHLGYLLVTHEFSAAAMADGYARSTGKPGVLCIVPGPGLTNSLSGLGEALLDSIPVVCIVGDVASGARNRPFQVHCLNHAALLEPVTKRVFSVQNVADIPAVVRQAFQLARAGEPGPVGVIIPYNLFIEASRFNSGPLAPAPVPFDPDATARAMDLLANCRLRVGIYAGLGCMDYAPGLVRLAELLQAPVATSMSGKGAMPENYALAVGWGYGPQGTRTAEAAFKNVDLVLALGVKYSEVSTGFYSQPQTRHLIHVDINNQNLGRIMRTSLCVHSDIGVFLSQVVEQADRLRRPPNHALANAICRHKQEERLQNAQVYARCGIDPMAFVLALRRLSAPDVLTFVDVTLSQYFAAEAFTTTEPRTFFNPTDNQAMGWSIPAAIGAQRVHPCRQTLTITGDGCFLMSAMEISTAARERLPVKFFILDDQAYHYMQELQRPAYLRTTATILTRMDYRAFAIAMGVGFVEIRSCDELESRVRCALEQPGPVLIRVAIDYRRPVRWIKAARARYTHELTREQKLRFLARIGSRSLEVHQPND
ncbi:MAG: thiamine pyrophosphate-binding protein [Planctomycetes bacterium]|nr:thiamine pyrophosphate-binding protein [Planctomycetota bacterium]